MQKVGIVTQKAAARFFSLEAGDRIPTVEELAKEFEASRGTTQAALSLLQEEKAVGFLSRGHLGTFVTAIDRLKLLEIAESKTMVGVMPLPYSKKYEALATGIFAALEENGLNAALAFMRGSDNRLRGLKEHRYDFAVISQFTAKYYLDRGESIYVVENFGRFSYVSEHALLIRDNDPCKDSDNFDGYKVGIDASSVDQKTLTLKFFKGKKVEYVPLVYSQIVPYLRLGKVDAAVWNLDDIDLAGNHLCYRSLANKSLNIIDTEAVIICLKENELVYRILKRMLNRDAVLKYQQDVLSGTIMPRY